MRAIFSVNHFMKLFSKLIGPIALVALVALSLLEGTSLDFALKWVSFLGRFHPVLLHLPIGLFTGVLLLEIYVLVRPVTRVPEKIHFLLMAAFYTAVVSALFGIFLSWEGGYNSDGLNFHKWAGIATVAVILVLDWLLKGRRAHPDKLPTTYFAGLVVTIGVISITGHQGGSLTHGSNFLTELNPFASQEEVKEITESTPVFISHIQPILKDYCYQCHNAEKIKGELRLDSFDHIMAGGVNGPVLVPGDSEGSNMLHAIGLPIDQDEHMPPKGKPQPTSDIINLLAWWIDQGASETARLDELNVTAEVAAHFMEIETLKFLSDEEVDAQLESIGKDDVFSFLYLVQNDFRLEVISKIASDADLDALLPLKANIVRLKLANSNVTDAGLESIGQMTNLTHLRLNNTAITDAGLEHISNLYQLEYLNLYGTGITDKGLSTLRRLKNLKSVFLFGTEVTEEAIVDLRHNLFDAVQAEKISLQIQELSKKRARLDITIASAFDPELQEPVDVDGYSEPEFSISDFMIEYHKGKNSLAAQTREGRADRDRVRVMVNRYRIMANVTPPKGSVEDWKIRVEELVESGNFFFLSGGPEAVDRYNAAVDCRACHTAHRTD
jgi:uncharacterized membrane protein